MASRPRPCSKPAASLWRCLSAAELRELGTGVGIQRVAAQALSMLGLRDELRKISGPGFEALRLLSWRDGHTMAAVPWHGEVVAVHRGELLEILARASAISASSTAAWSASASVRMQAASRRYSQPAENLARPH